MRRLSLLSLFFPAWYMIASWIISVLRFCARSDAACATG